MRSHPVGCRFCQWFLCWGSCLRINHHCCCGGRPSWSCRFLPKLSFDFNNSCSLAFRLFYTAATSTRPARSCTLLQRRSFPFSDILPSATTLTIRFSASRFFLDDSKATKTYISGKEQKPEIKLPSSTMQVSKTCYSRKIVIKLYMDLSHLIGWIIN